MIYILVVLYKKSLQESETLRGIVSSASFLKNVDHTVHIWDNSPSEALSIGDKKLLNSLVKLEYTFCPENRPLSFVYNKAINFIKRQTNFTHLILLDHDSSISCEYFKEIYSLVQPGLPQADIILPQVKSGNIIISPAKFFLVKGIYFTKIDPGFCNKRLLAINSGMVISKKFLSATNFLYDERLLNYGTDNYFLNFANRHNAIFYIMQFSFTHGYSFYEEGDNDKRAEVFWQIKKANTLVFSAGLIQQVSIYIYNLIASIKNVLKYKSIRYLIKK